MHAASLAEPLNCPNCGRPVALPQRSDALLDERGWAHILCECGFAIVVPLENVDPTPMPRKNRRPSWVAAVLWIVIIAMVALLLPAIRVVYRDPEPPQPPSYMTT